MCGEIKDPDDWETKECHHSDSCLEYFVKYEVKDNSRACTNLYRIEQARGDLLAMVWGIEQKIKKITESLKEIREEIRENLHE